MEKLPVVFSRKPHAPLAARPLKATPVLWPRVGHDVVFGAQWISLDVFELVTIEGRAWSRAADKNISQSIPTNLRQHEKAD
jgi:hypothetical protein